MTSPRVLTHITTLFLVMLCAQIPHYALSAQGVQSLPAGSCTNILVGREASVDGSTIASMSGDSIIFYSYMHVTPRRQYPPNTKVPIFHRPFSSNYAEYQVALGNEEWIGEIDQVEETYAYIDLSGSFDKEHGLGMNEYGVTIGETTIGGRPALENSKAWLMAISSCPEGSLGALAFQRAKNAREAIEIIGELAEEYGYQQPGCRGEQLSISDGNEVWSLEIFGPGPDWTGPGCGLSGAVWCAQRIPDGHVGVSANRSRIGEIDPADPDRFLCSGNVYSLAEDMGWWDSSTGDPFVWYEAYAPDNCMTYCSRREWRVLSMVAPSLNLDPNDERFPFSVEPETPVSVQDVMALHRDYYQGTAYDITDDPELQVNGELSPIVYPYYAYGEDELQKLLDPSHKPKRTLAVRSSGSYVAQVREGVPAAIKGCLWFGLGPASTTCYVPIYSGVTSFPERWETTLMTKIDWETAFWAFNLVHELAHIRWQAAYADIDAVRDTAEAKLFHVQPYVEQQLTHIASVQGETAARALATSYTNSCLDAVLDGYWDLVDYLLFTYFFLASDKVPQVLPEILLPDAPDPYADSVLTVSLGADANPTAADPLEALGCPNGSYTPPYGLLNLGTGGSITLRFDNNLAMNGPGDDLRIWSDPSNDDEILVEVSPTGQQFHSMGIVTESASLDLDIVGLDFARLIRITDVGPPPGPNEAYPGAELDAVEALH